MAIHEAHLLRNEVESPQASRIEHDVAARSLERRIRHSLSRVGSSVVSWMDAYGWAVLALLVSVTMILGFIGFTQYFESHPHNGPHSIFDRIYYSLQLSALQSRASDEHLPATLLIARFLAPLAAAVGVIGAFRALVRAFERGEWRVRRARNHVIVCGLGRKGSVLARLLAQDRMVVVGVDNGSDPHLVERCRSEKVLVTSGDADDAAVLKRARLAQAQCLVAVCGDDETNARIALAASELLKDSSNGPQVVVHISDHAFGELVEHRFGKLVERRDPGSISVEVINVYCEAADAMLGTFPDDVEPGQGVLVAGLGALGLEVVVTATTKWRACYPGEKLKVFALDRRAQEKVDHLRLRHPELNDTWTLVPLPEDLTGPAFARGDYLIPQHRDVIRAAYVCIDGEKLALTTALQLGGDLNGDGSGRRKKIKVRMPDRDGGLAKLIASDDVEVFHWLDEACTPKHFNIAAWIKRHVSDEPDSGGNE